MFTVDIIEHIGTFSKYPNGWTRELNVCSWCSGEPNIDIRDWDRTHEHMSRGIKLNEEEARTLYKLLGEYFESREV